MYYDPLGNELSMGSGEPASQRLWTNPNTGETYQGTFVADNPRIDAFGKSSLSSNSGRYVWGRAQNASSSSQRNTGITQYTNTISGGGTLPNQSTQQIAQGLPNLSLQRYTGDTNVEITPEMRNTIGLTDDLVTGQYGNYRSLLSGQADYGAMQRLNNVANEQFRTQTMPGLAQIYSGGAYGDNYWSGARQGAQAQALQSLANNQAGLRYQEQQQAKTNMFQALSALPGMMDVQNTEYKAAVENKNREISVFYQNQGLTQQEWAADMNVLQQALEQSKFDWTKYLGSETLEQNQAQFNVTASQNAQKIAIDQQTANTALISAYLQNAYRGNTQQTANRSLSGAYSGSTVSPIEANNYTAYNNPISYNGNSSIRSYNTVSSRNTPWLT